MSAKTIYTCDHCGASVSPYIGEQWAAMISTVGPSIPGVHGCSKEHLGLALAKVFDLPVNVDVAHLQSEANAKSARITELETAWDMLKKSLDESDLQRRSLPARIAALEASLAPVTADGKTPGQVNHEAREASVLEKHPGIEPRQWRYLSSEEKHNEEQGAAAVLRAFGGNAPPSTDTEHGLGVVRPPFAGNDHPHEVGSCSHCDAQSLTTTKPPVKPLEALATYWENGAKNSQAMSEGYRQAMRDCAKELRETLASITVPTKPTKPVSQ